MIRFAALVAALVTAFVAGALAAILLPTAVPEDWYESERERAAPPRKPVPKPAWPWYAWDSDGRGHELPDPQEAGA